MIPQAFNSLPQMQQPNLANPEMIKEETSSFLASTTPKFTKFSLNYSNFQHHHIENSELCSLYTLTTILNLPAHENTLKMLYHQIRLTALAAEKVYTSCKKLLAT